MAALLFYDSMWACIPGCPFLLVYCRWKRKELIVQRKKELRSQFREGILGLATALQAGSSAEHAVKEAAQDLRRMEWTEAHMGRELEEMYRKISAGQTIEQVFLDFSVRSGIEDAYLFAEIFAVSKRTGQDLTKVIGNAVRMISEKIEVEQEIETVLSARIYEQRIMSIMPMGILLYLRVTSGEFLDPLYHNTFGAILMTGCLMAYALTWRWGKRLVEIEL